MFATVTLLTLVNSVSGTPYVSGGDSPRGTDCSGLVSWVTNAASGRPIYGDRFNTGKIARHHGNRYLRVLFVQAAWVVLVKIKDWERYGLKSWIEAAKRRLHHNVLAIALANKLARIAWAVLAKGLAFELTRTNDAGVRPA